jgi:hypothetical protein
MERIAETMQKFPACCLEDTFGLVHPKNAVWFCGVAGLRFFTRCVVNLWPVGPDDDGNTHFSEPLPRRCRWGTASGICLVPPDLPLFGCGYSLGAGSESDRLVDHRDEFCRLSLPPTGLFGRVGVQLPHDFRSKKPTRAPASGSPIYSIGDPSHSISPDRAALAFSPAVA